MRVFSQTRTTERAGTKSPDFRSQHIRVRVMAIIATCVICLVVVRLRMGCYVMRGKNKVISSR